MFFAYLDAGSGSLILQAVLGGIAGVVVAAKAWRARLIDRKGANTSDQSESTSDESALTES
jgi:hypothetical protein